MEFQGLSKDANNGDTKHNKAFKIRQMPFKHAGETGSRGTRDSMTYAHVIKNKNNRPRHNRGPCVIGRKALFCTCLTKHMSRSMDSCGPLRIYMPSG